MNIADALLAKGCVLDQGGLNYEDAVRNSFWKDFGGSYEDTSGTKEAFRRAVFEAVITPLADNVAG